MHVERHLVELTTAADGTATGYTPVVTGRVLAVRYVKNNFDNGVDFTITSETTGQTIWTQTDVNAAAIVYPRTAVHDTAGVAATLDGTVPMRDAVPVANERIRIAIAQGGNVKSGSFIVLIG